MIETLFCIHPVAQCAGRTAVDLRDQPVCRSVFDPEPGAFFGTVYLRQHFDADPRVLANLGLPDDGQFVV